MYEVKTYVVQKPDGTVVGVKLTREAAQSLARLHAPASVTPFWADKFVIKGLDKPVRLCS